MRPVSDRQNYHLKISMDISKANPHLSIAAKTWLIGDNQQNGITNENMLDFSLDDCAIYPTRLHADAMM